jgi:hypothetical protein
MFKVHKRSYNVERFDNSENDEKDVSDHARWKCEIHEDIEHRDAG